MLLPVLYKRLSISFALLLTAVCTSVAQTDNGQLIYKPWFETRTAHFNIYSCGDYASVNRLAARLEQFCQAYSMLAGKGAVASPPTVVMAFPDQDTMRPFLPLYNGQPGNLAGFFTRASDENLIVLALPSADAGTDGMNVIFHEYAHLLFRRNDQVWPLWLKEGMAEIYSTFQTSGDTMEIARPIDHHLRLLAQQPFMPLPALFAVSHDSPEYNERSLQGVFYAESWLLTHYLMAGDNAVIRARFARFTPLLLAGQNTEEAFTNALGVSLPTMELALHQYLDRGQFPPLSFSMPSGVASAVMVSTRAMTPVQVYYRLGDELLRIDRPDDAQSYFTQARTLAPKSPLPYEGLGMLAARREQHGDALSDLTTALQLNSTSFLAYYIAAQEKYRLTSDGQGRYTHLNGDQASEVLEPLEKSISLMPNFGPSHELLGFFEMVQDNLSAAEEQLQLAIQLEPENPSYLITLAQEELRAQNPDAARATLAPLLLPNADKKLKATAEEMVSQIKN